MNSSMEKQLYEASLTGNISALNELLQQDQLILDKISLTSTFIQTPLHIAALRGHHDFVRFVLDRKPDLATTLDSLRRSPLHLAAASGHVKIVEELLNVKGGLKLCDALDQDGRSPLHLAALNEHLEVIKVLIQARPEITKEEVDVGENVLYLCVMNNRFESFKLLMEFWDEEVVAKMVDCDGNTLLHLSAMYKQIETMKFLLAKPSIKANGNAVNIHGFTPMDVLDHSPRDFKALEMREILTESGIKRAKDLKPTPSTTKSPIQTPRLVTKTSNQNQKGCIPKVCNNFFKNETPNWLERARGNLIIAETIIAAISFYAAIHPPGGTYFDSNNGRVAGNAVQAEIDMDQFSQFLTLNTIPLIVSLISILILVSGFNLKNKFIMWLLMQGMLTTFVFIILTYLQSISIMSPDGYINPGTIYMCLFGILLCAIFALVSTVYFIVCGVKRKIAKRRTGRSERGKIENPITV